MVKNCDGKLRALGIYPYHRAFRTKNGRKMAAYSRRNETKNGAFETKNKLGQSNEHQESAGSSAPRFKLFLWRAKPALTSGCCCPVFLARTRWEWTLVALGEYYSERNLPQTRVNFSRDAYRSESVAAVL